MIRNMLVVVLLMMLVPCFAQGITSGSDFVGVPTADVVAPGQVDLTVYSFGSGLPTAKRNNESFRATVGIFDNLEVSANGSLEDIAMDNIFFGIKYAVDTAEAGYGWVKPAIFLYNIGDGRVGIPGVALSYDKPNSRFSTSIAGWKDDESWEAGIGADYYIGGGIRLIGEYGTKDSSAMAGLGLSYKWLKARILKAEKDDWFIEAGINMPLWD